MISSRPSQAESRVVALFDHVVAEQLDQICLELSLPRVELDLRAPVSVVSLAIWDRCEKLGGTTLADLEDALRRSQRRPAALPLVYLSVAEIDRDEELSRQFFSDLVARLAPGFPDRDLRYFDEGNRGDPDIWSPWALRAMREASVFVPLYSGNYFRSPYCGRVWAAFRHRLQRQRAAHELTVDPPLICPVLWGPPDEYPDILPAVAQDIDVDHGVYGSLYVEHGLRRIVQHAKAGRADWVKAYEEFLDTFVQQLLHAMATHPLAADITIPTLREISSDFYDAIAEQRAAGDQGAKFAKFVFIAASRDEIRALRSGEQYGPEARHWRPYFPPTEQRLETLGMRIADDNKMDPEVFALDDELLSKIRSANQSGNVILVFADPWALHLNRYRQYAEQYDGADVKNSSLLICWNLEDRQTAKSRAALRKRVNEVFFNKLERRNRVRDEIQSVEQLRDAIAQSLLSVRRDILDSTESPSVAEGLGFVRPTSVVAKSSSAAPGPAPTPPRSAQSSSTGVIFQPRIDSSAAGTQQ